jgi:hypothetical protein
MGMGWDGAGAAPAPDRAEPSRGAAAAVAPGFASRPAASYDDRELAGLSLRELIRLAAEAAPNEATAAQLAAGSGANATAAPGPGGARGLSATYSDRELEAMKARYWSRLAAEEAEVDLPPAALL